jgi:hypothetical protein
LTAVSRPHGGPSTRTEYRQLGHGWSPSTFGTNHPVPRTLSSCQGATKEIGAFCHAGDAWGLLGPQLAAAGGGLGAEAIDSLDASGCDGYGVEGRLPWEQAEFACAGDRLGPGRDPKLSIDGLDLASDGGDRDRQLAADLTGR